MKRDFCVTTTKGIEELKDKLPEESLESVKNLVGIYWEKNPDKFEEYPSAEELRSFRDSLRNKSNISSKTKAEILEFSGEFEGSQNHLVGIVPESILLKVEDYILGDGVLTEKEAQQFLNYTKAAISQSKLESLSEVYSNSKDNLLAPNGNVSNLSKENYALVRTKAFKEWFGDWENDPDNSSKVVDENGEPLLVYHGTNAEFNNFNISRAGKNTGLTKYTDNRTGEEFTSDSVGSIFFSNSLGVGVNYGILGVYNDIRTTQVLVKSLIETFPNGKYNKDIFKSYEEVVKFLDSLSKYNPEFSNIVSLIRKNREDGKKLSKSERDTIYNMLVDIKKRLEGKNKWSLQTTSEWFDILANAKSILRRYNTESGIQKLLSGEIPKEVLSKWYSENHLEKQDIESVVFMGWNPNGYIPKFSYTKEKGLFIDMDSHTTYEVTKLTKDKLKEILDTLTDSVKTGINNYNTDNTFTELSKGVRIFSAFLNIRNPFEHDYEGTRMGGGYKGNEAIPFGYITARQRKRANERGNDGMIYKNVEDPFLSDNYAVFNENQIMVVSKESPVLTLPSSENIPVSKINRDKFAEISKPRIQREDTTTDDIRKVNLTYNAYTRRDRVNLITSLFSKRLTEVLEAEKKRLNDKLSDSNIPEWRKRGISQALNSLNRQQLISRLTPKGIFDLVKKGFQDYIEKSEEDRIKLELNAINKIKGSEKVSDEKKKAVAEKRAKYKYIEYQKLIDNFNALAQEACPSISTREQVLIGSIGQLSKNMSKEESWMEDEDTMPEDSPESISTKEESPKDGWMRNFRTVTSRESLSKEVAAMFGNIIEVDYNGRPAKDDLGNQRRLDAGRVHVALMHKLAKMTKATDMIPLLQDLAKYKPWVKQIIKTIQEDNSLFTKLYVDMRKDAMNYTVIVKEKIEDSYVTKTKKVNQMEPVMYLIDDMRSNYESATPLDDDSIYGKDRSINLSHVDKGLSLISSLMSTIKGKTVEELSDMVEKDNSILNDFGKVLKMIGFDVTPEMVKFIALPKDTNASKAYSLLGNLNSLYNAVKNDGNNKNFNLLVDTRNLLYKVASQLESVQEHFVEFTFREAGKSYSSHVTPSFLGKLVKEVKGVDGDANRALKYIEKEFGQYKWFKKGDTWLNSIVENLYKSSTDREELEWKVELNMDRIEYTEWDSVDYMNVILQNYFADNTEFGYFYVPILSDAPSAEFLRLRKVSSEIDPVTLETISYKEAIVRKMYNLVVQEYDRIRVVRERRGLIKEGKIKAIKYYDTSGDTFEFIPELNDFRDPETGKLFLERLIELKNANVPGNLKEFVYSSLRTIMEEKFKTALSYWEEIGLFDVSDEKSGSKLKNLPINIAANKEEWVPKLEEFFWNNTYMQSQIIQFTAGDLAFYKNMEDFQKRFKEFHSPALKPNTKATWNGELVGRENERVIYLNDEIGISRSLKEIEKVLDAKVAAKKMTKLDKEFILSQYKGINITDAQAFRSLSSYRRVMIMMGKWSDEAETAYNHLTRPNEYGKWDASDFYVIWQTIKPYMFSMVGVDSHVGDYGKIKVGVQHKNSEFLLLAIYDAIVSPVSSSPKLRAINKFMEANKYDIDVVMFNSAVKTGEQGTIDLNGLTTEDEIYKHLEEEVTINGKENNEVIHTFPYDDWGVQMSTPEHMMDVTIALGTQMRKLIPADFPNTASIDIEVSPGNIVTKTKEEWLQLYSDLVTSSIVDQFNELDNIFNLKDENGNISREKLSELLQDEARGNSRYSQDIVNACKLRPDGNFNIPLYEEIQSKRVQMLISSIIRNRVTKQKIKGGGCFQVSDYGLSEDLHIEWTKDGGIKHLECYMPAYSREFFEPLMKEDGSLDINKLPEELRRFVGYRVPTEDKYSILPLYIKGFLPQQNGSSIMLPQEITTITGSDFDIDKLYILLPEFDVSTKTDWRKLTRDIKHSNGFKSYKDKVGQVKAERDLDIAIELVKNNKEYSEDSLEAFIAQYLKEHGDVYNITNISKVSYDFSKSPNNNSKAARNNLFIDMVTSILNHKDTASKIIQPGGFEPLKRTDRLIRVITEVPRDKIDGYCKENNISYEQFTKLGIDKYESLLKAYGKKVDPLSVITQLEFHRKNTIGGGMIGIYANHNVNHAISQFTDMKIDYKNSFIFNNKRLTSLHEIYNNYDEIISRNVAIWLAASVDNVKDNTLDSTNQNYFTGDVTMLLTRLGYQHHEVAVLMNQPIVKWLTTEWFRERNFSRTKYDFIEEKLASLKTNIAIDEKTIDNDRFILNDLIGDILGKVDIHNASQVKTGILFMKMMSSAEALADIVRCSRSDVSNMAAGPTIADILVKLLRINKLAIRASKKGFPIKNSGMPTPESDDFSGPIGYMQAFYKKGIEDTKLLLKEHFPHFNKGFMSVINELADETTTGALNAKDINDIIDNLFTYIMSGTEFFGNDTDISSSLKRERYINNFPDEFVKFKDTYPEIANNRLIKNLKIVNGNRYSNVPYIAFNNVGSLSQAQREDMSNDWTALLYSNNPAANRLALDLFLYSYYRSGFAFGPDSFIHLAPNEVKYNIPDYIKTLESLIGSEELYDEFIEQYVRNHSYNSKFIREVKESDLEETEKANPHAITYDKENGTIRIDLNTHVFYDWMRPLVKEKSEADIVPYTFIKVQTKNGEKLFKAEPHYFTDISGIWDFNEVSPLGKRNCFLEYEKDNVDIKTAIHERQAPNAMTLEEKKKMLGDAWLPSDDPNWKPEDDISNYDNSISIIDRDSKEESEEGTDIEKQANKEAFNAILNKEMPDSSKDISMKDLPMDKDFKDANGKPVC